MLLRDDKEQTISTSASWVHLKCLAEKKEADLKGYIMLMLIQLSVKGKTIGPENRSVIARA